MVKCKLGEERLRKVGRSKKQRGEGKRRERLRKVEISKQQRREGKRRLG